MCILSTAALSALWSLQVNGISFEKMSNDDAVRTLREIVQQPGYVYVL